MIVVVLIGLLAAIAIPSYQRVRLRSQATSIAENLRTYAHAFEVYATETGQWPPDKLPSQTPPEMEGRLSRFERLSPLGGRWDWEYNASGVTAGVSHRLAGVNNKLLLTIDEVLDDGNLATGRVRLIYPNQLTYILVP